MGPILKLFLTVTENFSGRFCLKENSRDLPPGFLFSVFSIQPFRTALLRKVNASQAVKL